MASPGDGAIFIFLVAFNCGEAEAGNGSQILFPLNVKISREKVEFLPQMVVSWKIY